MPFGRADVRIGMEEEALEASLFRSAEDAVEVPGRHGVARVGRPARRYPADAFVRIADGLQGTAGFPVHDGGEELVGEPHLHVHQGAYARQVDAEEQFHHVEGVLLGERRVPLPQPLHPAGDRPVHAVEAPVPVIVLGEDEVEPGGHGVVVLAGQ